MKALSIQHPDAARMLAAAGVTRAQVADYMSRHAVIAPPPERRYRRLQIEAENRTEYTRKYEALRRRWKREGRAQATLSERLQPIAQP